jgi:hypothetical protein
MYVEISWDRPIAEISSNSRRRGSFARTWHSTVLDFPDP